MHNHAKSITESGRARLGLRLTSVAVLALVSTGVLAAGAGGQAASLEGRFRGETANMTPEGLELRIDILRWSSEEERRSVVERLAGDADAGVGLTDLPTVGYIWPSDVGVGYALKYAHQAVAADGSERITVVTDRLLGTFGRERWRDADGETDGHDVSVVELRLDADGTGSGTTSLVAGLTLDETQALVSLEASGEAPVVIDGVTREGP